MWRGSIREKQGGRKSQSQMWCPLDVSLSLAYGLRVWPAFALSSILSIIKEGDSNMDPPALEGIWGLSNGFTGCYFSVAKSCVCVCMCVCALSHIWLFVTPWTLACQAPLEFPGKNAGVGCHFLLQRILPTQGSNLCLLHLLLCSADSLPPHHLECQHHMGSLFLHSLLWQFFLQSRRERLPFLILKFLWCSSLECYLNKKKKKKKQKKPGVK